MPDNPKHKVIQLWRRHLERGLGELQRGQSAAAAEAFERALNEAPNEPEVLLFLGHQRFRQRRFEECAELLERAIALRPESTATSALLARVLGLHLDRGEEAFKVLHRALAHDLDCPPLHVIRGELLLEEGAIEEARAAFGRVLDLDLTDEPARAGMARTYNLEGIALSEEAQYDRAIFCFKRASDLDPEWSGPWVNTGVAFGRLGQLERALEAYDTALERDPGNPVALFNLATSLQETGHPAAAVERFEELLDRCPDYPNVRAALANVLGELGQLDRAIALLLEELEIDDRSAGSWSSLGLAYICSGSAERGEQCLKRAIEIEPDYFNALYNLASFYATTRRFDEAEELVRQIFELHPELAAKTLQGDRQFDPLDLSRFQAPPKN